MITKQYRVKFSPFTLTTVLQFTQSHTVATRIELLALDGTIIGGVYMYSDDDSMGSLLLEDITQSS